MVLRQSHNCEAKRVFVLEFYVRPDLTAKICQEDVAIHVSFLTRLIKSFHRLFKLSVFVMKSHQYIKFFLHRRVADFYVDQEGWERTLFSPVFSLDHRATNRFFQALHLVRR